MELILSLAAVVVSVASLWYSIRLYDRGETRKRKQATLEAFGALQAEVFDPLNRIRREEVEEIVRDHHSEAYLTMVGWLARCTHFAVGVNCGIYDREVATRLAGRYLIVVYEKLEPLIEKKRAFNQSERHYHELEDFVNGLRDHYDIGGRTSWQNL